MLSHNIRKHVFLYQVTGKTIKLHFRQNANECIISSVPWHTETMSADLESIVCARMTIWMWNIILAALFLFQRRA